MGEGNIGAEKGQGQSPCQGAVFKYVLGKKRGKGRISMHFPGQARAASWARQCTCYPRIHVILRLYPFMARRTPPALLVTNGPCDSSLSVASRRRTFFFLFILPLLALVFAHNAPHLSLIRLPVYNTYYMVLAFLFFRFGRPVLHHSFCPIRSPVLRTALSSPPLPPFAQDSPLAHTGAPSSALENFC